MPKLTKEISSGSQFQRSADQGRLADSQTRVFRILLNDPGEVVNPQTECGIRIGDRHPVNANIYCVSWDVKFEGDSRTVMVATFNYQSTPASQGQDKNEQPPDVRPANWSTSTSIIEIPVHTWREVFGADPTQYGPPDAAVNSVGDMIDGASRYEAIVTVTVEQYVPNDPTEHCLYAGTVNLNQINIGSLQCFTGSLMFRGVQSKPVVESWGDVIYRGWVGTYEFAFRKNHVEGMWDRIAEQKFDADIGWDVAMPETGFNVKCNLAAANVEKAGMPLKHSSGKIDGWPNNVLLPDGVAVGQKARAMVLVHEYENGGASQLPSAQPIPLNADGTPRSATADPKVLITRYRPHQMIDFIDKLKIRLG